MTQSPINWTNVWLRLMLETEDVNKLSDPTFIKKEIEKIVNDEFDNWWEALVIVIPGKSLTLGETGYHPGGSVDAHFLSTADIQHFELDE